jgi:hypothetical protein
MNATKLQRILVESPDGRVLHIFDMASREKVLPEIKRALRDGKVVQWEDGSREWWEMRELVDTTKSGSAQYQWDSSGQKVRAERIRHLLTRDGKKTTVLMPGKHYVWLS